MQKPSPRAGPQVLGPKTQVWMDLERRGASSARAVPAFALTFSSFIHGVRGAAESARGGRGGADVLCCRSAAAASHHEMCLTSRPEVSEGVCLNLVLPQKRREKQSLTVHFIRVEIHSLKVAASLIPGVKGQMVTLATAAPNQRARRPLYEGPRKFSAKFAVKKIAGERFKSFQSINSVDG